MVFFFNEKALFCRFSLFGELFDEAIRNGLTALQVELTLCVNTLAIYGNDSPSSFGKVNV